MENADLVLINIILYCFESSLYSLEPNVLLWQEEPS